MTAMSTEISSIADQLCRVIIDELSWEGSAEQLVGRDPVKLTEILDSASLLELACIVEGEYDIEIDDSEIAPEYFATVPVLAATILSKIEPRAAAAS